jgi:hypothetical protein
MPSAVCDHWPVTHGELEQELQATVEARKELGPAHEENLIAGFLDRIEHEIDRRVDERLKKRVKKPAVTKEELGIAIPLVVVAGIFGGATGIIAVAIALAVIFIAITALNR